LDDAAEFRLLVARLKAGDPAAIDEAYRRFGPYIRTSVRRQLHPALRSRFDSLDFVQEVWAAYLSAPQARKEFDNLDAFLVYLGKMARNKVVDVCRQRFVGEKDSLKAESSFDDPRGIGHQQVLARTPTPSQWAIAGEELQRLLGQFRPGHRVIIERLRDGYSLGDIARMANVSVSTVNRVIRRLKELTGVDV
jgi:RNA polymerase sigma-70 factor (ECF subfamily)